DSLNAADGSLDWAGDSHEHLIDRHHAVVDADDDARKVSGRENGNWNTEKKISADKRQRNDEEDDGFVLPRKPVTLGFLLRPFRRARIPFAWIRHGSLDKRSVALAGLLGGFRWLRNRHFRFVRQAIGALRYHLLTGLEPAQDLHF